MSNIAILNSHTLWPVHFETELEIIQDHLDAGDTVYQVACNGSIRICDLNMEGDPMVCLQCISKRKKGASLLQGLDNFHVLEYNQLTGEDRKMIQDTKFPYSSIEELKALKYENFDIGLAVLSSIITIVRDSSLDFIFYKNTIDRHLQNALMIFLATRRVVRKYNISRYYVFNGRFAYPRAVFRACQQLSVDCYIHEVGSSIHKYDIFINELPHNIRYLQQLIENAWLKAPADQRESLGNLWYTERINAIPQNYTSFVSGQDPDKLPDSWDESKHNIIIFNSSEDEMVSIGEEWKNQLYNDQLDGIQKVVRDLSVFPEIRVYLRMHPNLHDVNDDYVKGLKKIKAENFELIDSLSKVSTYRLLKSANKVVTFGSSTGIEAAYLGSVSVLLGASYYKGKGCVYEPKTHEEVIKLLTDFSIQPLTTDFPLKYGHYFKTRGIDFKHYKASKVFQGSFKNVDLNAYQSRKFKLLNQRVFNNRIVKNNMSRLYRRFIIGLARI